MVIARRSHPFPSRTRKLSFSAPMVLHGQLCGRVGHRRILYLKMLPATRLGSIFFCPHLFKTNLSRDPGLGCGLCHANTFYFLSAQLLLLLFLLHACYHEFASKRLIQLFPCFIIVFSGDYFVLKRYYSFKIMMQIYEKEQTQKNK